MDFFADLFCKISAKYQQILHNSSERNHPCISFSVISSFTFSLNRYLVLFFSYIIQDDHVHLNNLSWSFQMLPRWYYYAHKWRWNRWNNCFVDHCIQRLINCYYLFSFIILCSVEKSIFIYVKPIKKLSDLSL